MAVVEDGAITDFIDDLREVCLPLVGAGVGVAVDTAAGDMVGVRCGETKRLRPTSE